MTTTSAKGAFLRALVAGALAGGVPWLVITAPLAAAGLVEGEIAGALFVIALPVILAGIIVLANMVVIGLPVTRLLAANGRECPRVYALAGAGFGLVIPPAFLLVFESSSFAWHSDLLILGANGLFAGAVTAFVWGKHRRQLHRHAAAIDTTPNPVHDLLF